MGRGCRGWVIRLLMGQDPSQSRRSIEQADAVTHGGGVYRFLSARFFFLSELPSLTWLLAGCTVPSRRPE